MKKNLIFILFILLSTSVFAENFFGKYISVTYSKTNKELKEEVLNHLNLTKKQNKVYKPTLISNNMSKNEIKVAEKNNKNLKAYNKRLQKLNEAFFKDFEENEKNKTIINNERIPCCLIGWTSNQENTKYTDKGANILTYGFQNYYYSTGKVRSTYIIDFEGNVYLDIKNKYTYFEGPMFERLTGTKWYFVDFYTDTIRTDKGDYSFKFSKSTSPKDSWRVGWATFINCMTSKITNKPECQKYQSSDF